MIVRRIEGRKSLVVADSMGSLFCGRCHPEHKILSSSGTTHNRKQA
jgi:hypothetical protein